MKIASTIAFIGAALFAVAVAIHVWAICFDPAWDIDLARWITVAVIDLGLGALFVAMGFFLRRLPSA